MHLQVERGFSRSDELNKFVTNLFVSLIDVVRDQGHIRRYWVEHTFRNRQSLCPGVQRPNTFLEFLYLVQERLQCLSSF